jgi:hypothetical protein
MEVATGKKEGSQEGVLLTQQVVLVLVLVLVLDLEAR